MRRWGILAPAIVIGVCLTLAGPALAHSNLESSDPPDGAVLSEPVTVLRFTFNQPVDPFADGFALTDLDGVRLGIESIQLRDDRTVLVTPNEPVTGAVVATWAIVAGDSHPMTDVITFTVVVPMPNDVQSEIVASTPPSTGTTSTTAPTPSSTLHSEPGNEDNRIVSSESDTVAPRTAIVSVAKRAASWAELARGLVSAAGYLSTVVVVGALAMVIRQNESDRRRFWSVVSAPIWFGVALLLTATVLLAATQLAVLSADLSAALQVAQWGDVFSGRLRTGVLLRLSGCWAVVLGWRSQRTVPAIIGSLLVLVSFPVLGHAADTSARWLVIPSSVTHVGAVSVWTGGLLTVLLAARRDRQDLPALVRSFSSLAAAALGAAVIAGSALAITKLDDVDALWKTPFGQRLMVKLALVAMVGCIGGVHRFRTVPKLSSVDGGARAKLEFIRLAQLELGLFVAILAATAWLVAGVN